MKRSPLKRTAPKPTRGFTPASKAQRVKVQFAGCVVCSAGPCDPSHLTPRACGGCDHDLCVLPMCRVHHRAFDDGALDLLPHVAGRGFRAELAHMQLHYDDPLSVVYRLSGVRWVPERTAA